MAAAKRAKGSSALLRKVALKLPEAVEAPHFHMPSFRVGGKIFATARDNEPVAMLKLPRQLQQAMCAAHPDCIRPVPGYWGLQGSTFVDTDAVDPKLFADLTASAWAAVAPKTLLAAAKKKA